MSESENKSASTTPDTQIQLAEMTDRAQKRAQNKREKTDTRTRDARMDAAQDDIESLLANSQLAADRKKKVRRYFRFGLWGAGILLCYQAYAFLFAPYQAGMTYGLCKVFLETSLRYPSHMRVSTVEDFGSSVRIWYTQVDSFGEFRLEPIQCFFKEDPTYGAALEKVTVNRRELDKKKIEAFNSALPAILSAPLDQTYPTALPDSLEDLKIETDKFRFQIF